MIFSWHSQVSKELSLEVQKLVKSILVTDLSFLFLIRGILRDGGRGKVRRERQRANHFSQDPQM